MRLGRIVKAVTSRVRNKLKENERKENRKPRKPPEDPSPGSSAFSSPGNLKASNPGAGKKSRTKTQAESTTARRMQAKEDAAKAKNIETGKKALTGTALVGAGYAAGKAGDSDKPIKVKSDKTVNNTGPKKSSPRTTRKKSGTTQAEKLKKQLQAESSGDRVKRSNPPKRATVTGKKDDIASRNISRDGKKQANVTREQLKRLGLDPKKKSSLTIYLNAYDRLNRRPKTKADLVAKKNMGGMMKKKGYAMGGMMKSKGSAKGGKMGGKMMPGYKKGGAVKKVSGGKRRGVGAAIRGFGKAMR